MFKKRSIAFLVISIIFFQMLLPIKCMASETISEINIPQEASEYANTHIAGLVDAVELYADNYDLSTNQLTNIYIGSPFVIYEVLQFAQDEIYYYPVYDKNQELIAVLSVMGTTDGWCVSMSQEWVSDLRTLAPSNSAYLFYKIGDDLYVENSLIKYHIDGSNEVEDNSFSRKSYIEKKNIIFDISSKFRKADMENVDFSLLDTYTPSFSTNTSSSKICSLYKKRGQGSLNVCWAASVATICNYRRGTNYTATGIADDMNISYDAGASIEVAQSALSMHEVSYSNLNKNSNSKMTWSTLKRNINGYLPVYVSAKISGSGHAVVAYGYSTTTAGTNYVILWNPGTANSITVEFKSSGTTFAYSNKTWTWTHSLSGI